MFDISCSFLVIPKSAATLLVIPRSEATRDLLFIAIFKSSTRGPGYPLASLGMTGRVASLGMTRYRLLTDMLAAVTATRLKYDSFAM